MASTNSSTASSAVAAGRTTVVEARIIAIVVVGCFIVGPRTAAIIVEVASRFEQPFAVGAGYSFGIDRIDFKPSVATRTRP